MQQIVKGATLLKESTTQTATENSGSAVLPKLDGGAPADLKKAPMPSDSFIDAMVAGDLQPYSQASQGASNSVAQNKSTVRFANTDVITMSGAHTGGNDPFFKFVDSAAQPGTHLPSKGKDIDEWTNELRASIDKSLAEGKNVLVIGYSISAAIAFNVIHDEYQGKPVEGIFIDPPYDVAIARTPLLDRMRNSRAVQEAAANGVKDDPGTVNWTDGKPFLGDHMLIHDAFHWPSFGHNRERIDALGEFIGQKLETMSAQHPENSPLDTPKLATRNDD